MGIFKAYDIRGRYPEEIHEDVAYKIGRAFVVFTKTTDIMLGVDCRTHSPSLREAFIHGATDQGANVTDIGFITTSQLIALKTWKNHNTAVMVTASHLDAPFNGFKMLTGVGQYVSERYGMNTVQELVENNNFPEPAHKGKHTHANYLEIYVEGILKLHTTKNPGGIFVADCSNGTNGAELHLLAKRTGLQLHIINDDPNGTFPNHSPNPIKPEAQAQAAAAIRRQHALGGCIFDADADRITFLDEKGNAIHPNYAACLLATAVLRKHPGSTIAYDLISSRAVPETITSHGGKALRTKVGRASIIDEMMQQKAALGVETSSHIMFKETSYGEATTLAMLLVIDELARTKKPLSELVSAYKKYELLGETNFETDKADLIMKAAEEEFAEGTVDYLDGVFFTFENSWVSLRKSNTEPLLRLRAEANTSVELQELVKRAKNLVERHGGHLSRH